MTVIATVSVPAEAFALGATMAVEPQARVQLERVIPTGQTFVPYLWTPTATVDPVSEGLREVPDVESVAVVDDTGEHTLLRVEWAESVHGLLEMLAETGATVLAGAGEAGTWRLRLRFSDPDSLSDFFQRCADRGVPVTLEVIHGADRDERAAVGLDLTEAQREALEVALEAGYFEVPRRIDLVELASRLGISDSAASERLRRGTATLLRDAIERPDKRRD